MFVSHSGFKSPERANSWVCGQNQTALHNFMRSSVPCTVSLSWELSTLPTFSSFTTKGLNSKMPSCNIFNTQIYTIAARLTPPPRAQTACCTVAQARRLPLQSQCRSPREAVNTTIWLWHLCPGSPLCLSLPGSPPGWGLLRGSWLTSGSPNLSPLWDSEKVTLLSGLTTSGNCR